MANDWFKSYLHNCTLVAKITTPPNKVTYSKTYKVTYGTAQDSCLGLLLFILFCNDIHTLPLDSSVILFADDITLFNSHRNRNYLQFSLEHDMYLLTEWFGLNQLSLNMDKTVTIHYWPDTKPNAKQFKITVNSEDIKVVENVKFLGVYIDQELNWKNHCSVVHSKLLANKLLLTMVHNVLNQSCLIKTYYAHIHSHLVYALGVWSSMETQKDIDDIFKLQKACVKFVHNVKKNAHTDPLFTGSQILKFPRYDNT